MTAELIRAADAAYPGDPNALAADVKVVLGYAGEPGYTPHVWSRAQVDAVRKSGRQWWAVWVPRQGDLSAEVGTHAADLAAEALPAYDHPKSAPVFLDIEYSSYVADEQGAYDAVAAFKAKMREHDYTQPYGYTPAAMGVDWVAKWWGASPVPTELPPGAIGQQYDGDDGGYDYSVFDRRLYDNDPQPAPFPSSDDNRKDLHMVKLFGLYRLPSGKIYRANYLAGTYSHVPDKATLDNTRGRWQRQYPGQWDDVTQVNHMARFGIEVRSSAGLLAAIGRLFAKNGGSK